MIKFYKVKDTEIRKVAEVDTEGKVLGIKAIVGQVSELLEKEIIFDDNTKGNEEKWLVIEGNATNITEFDSLAEAKDFCKGRWSK